MYLHYIKKSNSIYFKDETSKSFILDITGISRILVGIYNRTPLCLCNVSGSCW